MRKLLLGWIILVLLLGCTAPIREPLSEPLGTHARLEKVLDEKGHHVLVFHDSQRNVTCWLYRSGYGGGISCLPDMDVR